MILFDTHALLWWVNDDGKISQKSLKVIEKAMKKNELLVSAISIWEICLLIKKGRLRLTMSIEVWLEKLEAASFITFVPVDNRIARTSVFLPKLTHQDPADRIIIATALTHGATLITSDKKILDYPHVKSMW